MRIPTRHLAISDADLWPIDAEHRYRLYARRGEGRHQELEVIAASATPQGIGLAIATLHEEEKARGRRLADLGVLGILDVLPDRDLPGPTGEWVVPPWQRGGDTR